MKLLLDTHAFMWWDSRSKRLSPRAYAACADPANHILLSVASVWEIQIKIQLGKLKLHAPLPAVIERQQQTNRIEILQITVAHVLAIDNLPQIHRDPFDRVLVAQANEEGARLVTGDPILSQYPVDVLW
jgi:PIN domain nuclease of toxin-antitoxin system